MKKRTRYVLLGLLRDEDMNGYEIKKNIEEFIENICTEDNFVLQTEDGNILAKEG